MKQTEARNGRKNIARGKRRENERSPGFNEQNRILPLLAERREGWGEGASSIELERFSFHKTFLNSTHDKVTVKEPVGAP
jgi:hypothetical protein